MAIINYFPGGSGGLLPQIIVTVDSGSTVTATLGGKTVTGVSDGTCVLNIPSYGEWIISATLGGKISLPLPAVQVDTVKIYSVTLALISPVLNENTWDLISLNSTIGANYWAVGDRKAVALNGTVGTLSLNSTYYVYILGFNHNSAKEGDGIHFGGFKTALSGGVDICLTDSKHGTGSTNGTKYFNINHSANINSGGWKDCDLRYDILGSVNSKNLQNATAITTTSPVSNTLMAALPSDLRAVIQPMTKYSDNTGDGDDASYVTATVDYLPLLAEYEIFGTRKHANSAEQNYQKQYTYFINGNSRIKYKSDSTSTAAIWWERSTYYSNATTFCCVHSNGNAYGSITSTSYGVAPAFKV